MSTGVEHRVFHRLGVELPVRHRITMPGQAQAGAWATGHTVNLSAGGMLLAAPSVTPSVARELLEGRAQIEVEFALGDGGPTISARGRTVWAQDLGSARGEAKIGVKFVGLDGTTRELVYRFVLAHVA